MADNTSKSIVVSYCGQKFGFARDDKNNGYWYCLSSNRSVFGYGLGCIVPRQYWTEIRSAALDQGIDFSLLHYSPPEKPAKVKSAKIYSGGKTRSEKKNDGGIKIF